MEKQRENRHHPAAENTAPANAQRALTRFLGTAQNNSQKKTDRSTKPKNGVRAESSISTACGRESRSRRKPANKNSPSPTVSAAARASV